MRLVFRELAKVLWQIGMEKFLKEYPSPFLVQMRDYHFSSNSSGLKTTSPLDLAILREIIAQAGEITQYPHEVIYLTRKENENQATGMISIGRASHNDVIIDLPMISRTQVLLRYDEKSKNYQITDAGSTNENQVNFDKLQPQAWRDLKNGDIICLGGAYNFAFYKPEMMGFVLKKYWADLPMVEDNEPRPLDRKEQPLPPRRRKTDQVESVTPPENMGGGDPGLGCKPKF